jgi:hypothetical protein
MTRPISEISQDDLLVLCLYGQLLFGRWWYLEGRLWFRRKWIQAQAPKAPSWVFRFDADHNYAHMGQVFVDENFGVVVKARNKKSVHASKAWNEIAF